MIRALLIAISLLVPPAGAGQATAAARPGAVWPPAPPKPPTSPLDQHVASFHLDGERTLQGLLKLAAQARLPMGIVWLREDIRGKPVHGAWSGASVSRILSAVLAHAPDYTFRDWNGTIEVYPRGGLDDRRSVFNLRIPSFEVHDDYASWASYTLRLAALSQAGAMKDDRLSHVPGHGTGFAASIPGGDRKFSLSARGWSVRRILDFIVRQGKDQDKIWLTIEDRSRRFGALSLYQTGVPYRGRYVPGNIQPAWELVGYGWDPVTGVARPDWTPRAPNAP